MVLKRNYYTKCLVLLTVIGAVFADDSTEEFTSETHPSTNGEICGLPPETGPCENNVIRYFYDADRDVCRQFIYGGCEGNLNRFNSVEECSTRCNRDTHIPQPSQAPIPAPDVSFTDVDSYLTLVNQSSEISFTFAAGYPFIQLKPKAMADFQLPLAKEISFEFRTPEAQGLLLYHTLVNTPTEEAKYELYVILEGGELKVIHVFGADETTLLVGKGLNRDQWHKVTIMLIPENAQLTVRVDDTLKSIALEGLDVKPSYDIKDDVKSILFVGGMNWAQDEIESSYLFEHFVGCLRRFRLRAGASKEELRDISPLKALYYEDITVGCINKCQSGENECRHGGICINHYDSVTCDCFGTKYEGKSCDYDNPTTLTLRGYSYVSYRIYDWRDRAHSEANRVSLRFRSSIGDSILFYAGGTFPHPSHVALTLLANASLYAEIDFGDGPYGVVLGEDLTMGVWHNFTLIHEGSRVDFYLNNRLTSVEIQGSLWHLRIDPHIYVGGDRKPLGPGLKSTNSFVGCLSEVYFNDINILHGLRINAPQAAHHGILPPEFGQCHDVTVLPITFPFAESEIGLNVTDPESQKFRMSLEFKTNGFQAVLAHGPVLSEGSAGFWELRLEKGEAQFVVIPDAENETFMLVLAKVGNKLSDGSWHHVLLEYEQGDLTIGLDFKRPIVVSKKVHFTTLNKIVIGTSRVLPNLGFVGCMRDLTLNGKVYDPRVLLNSGEVREVSLDNCLLVDPCQRPNACEHGGQCMVDEGKVVCDCTGTGYTGKNCHFALYKRTCEELALLGYMKSGVYEIDIDGNGPHPPAHVRCQFDLQTGVRKTVVEHDLLRDTEIRSRNLGDLLLPLTYREFTPDMLQSLISQSLQCRQYIRYDCYRAPLELHSYTWFRASSGTLLDYLGSTQPGRCPCSEEKTCVRANVSCNCDADEDRWNSDEGYLTKSGELGVTEIFSLQQRKLHQTGEGRITLGPLECVEANTQQYVVTFKSASAYMEVPGWHRGDLSFSFRTSGEQGILLYQPLLHPKHPYFRVVLVNDHELTLEFSINGEPRSATVKSSRDLNSGEWQQVWIDYNEYHVRFTVNQESILMDLNDGEEFGPFEATLFIGGAPEEMLETNNYEGLIGCFRGLVMNNEVVNLYAYMNARFPDMIQKHCRPSCDPNPCRNGATCVEFWGSYKCKCENPLAHFGQNCETDINENALTFRTPSAFVEANVTSVSKAAELGLLSFFNEDILLNLRSFDNQAVIFYAYDYLNNFVQLHIEEGKKLVLTFNSDNTIHNISVEIDGLSSGMPVQVLVKRDSTQTSLHANEFQATLQVPLVFLKKYRRNPWSNKRMEMIKPPRPVSKPEEFYQVFLGGLDFEYMESSLQGFTGCLRGLKVGSQLVDFALFAAQMTSVIEAGKNPTLNWHMKNNDDAKGDQGIGGPGMMFGCKMLCDKQPCENEGVCQENFRLQSYSCDCDLTSYFGAICTEEKGAHFGGDSTIIAKHNAIDLYHVKVQLAFSTTAVRNIAQALLLIQTSKDKTKYLLISLTALGYLRIEEDRGTGLVFGAEVKTINFLNGARHSIYYRRKGDFTYLLIDRDEVAIRTLSASIHPEGLVDVTDENALHVGGVRNTSDPRFTDYDRFDGCLSNVVVQIDDEEIQPLLVYLGYRRWGSGLEAVTSHDPDGIEEEARCAAFSITPPGVIEQPSVANNEAQVPDWYPKPPIMLSYRSAFQAPPRFDPSVMNRVLVGLGILFAVFGVGLVVFLVRTHRKSRDLEDFEDEQPLLKPSGSLRIPLRSALKTANPPRSLADINSALDLGETPEKTDVLAVPILEQNGIVLAAPASEANPVTEQEPAIPEEPEVPEEPTVEAVSEETKKRSSIRKAPLSRISEANLSDSEEKHSPPSSSED